jgi:predicted nucleic acid-binding protein
LIIADTSVLLDVVRNDAVWGKRARQVLDNAAANDLVVINDVIFAEMSARYPSLEEFETTLSLVPLSHRAIPRQALFLAAKAFQRYRRRGGTKTVLSDFFIGAHAAVEGAALLTRDPRHVRAYFPSVTLISP